MITAEVALKVGQWRPLSPNTVQSVRGMNDTKCQTVIIQVSTRMWTIDVNQVEAGFKIWGSR